MLEPSFRYLPRIIARGSLWSSCAKGMHPNQRFYKYYWWIFWRESPVEGWAFLRPAYRQSTADAMRFREQLHEAQEPYLLYNKQYPRLDPTNPFNPNHARWRKVVWAPAWDDDPDEVWEGHK